MKKIELSEQEKEVIRQQLNGEFDGWTATEEQQKLMTQVIHKAEDLLEELDEYDTMGDDLILWYWNKYQAQEAAQ